MRPGPASRTLLELPSTTTTLWRSAAGELIIATGVPGAMRPPMLGATGLDGSSNDLKVSYS
jgi:hypothetical protein